MVVGYIVHSCVDELGPGQDGESHVSAHEIKFTVCQASRSGQYMSTPVVPLLLTSRQCSYGFLFQTQSASLTVDNLADHSPRAIALARSHPGWETASYPSG